MKGAVPRPKPYKLTDGGGLFLLVNPNGTRWWRYKFRFGGKEKSLALGAFPTVSLKEARDGRDAARQLLKAGQDPAAERQNAKRDTQLAAANLFETIARDFVKDRQKFNGLTSMPRPCSGGLN